MSAVRRPSSGRRRTAAGRMLVGTRPMRAVQSVELEVVAREAGVHPELARRLVRLGLFDDVSGSGGTRFPRDASARLAQAVRLRRDLGLSYAGALLASQLLARIERLEERLSRYEDPRGGSTDGVARQSKRPNAE
jgi:hypothetical protein